MMLRHAAATALIAVWHAEFLADGQVVGRVPHPLPAYCAAPTQVVLSRDTLWPPPKKGRGLRRWYGVANTETERGIGDSSGQRLTLHGSGWEPYSACSEGRIVMMERSDTHE
jgi:hypothetical protein